MVRLETYPNCAIPQLHQSVRATRCNGWQGCVLQRDYVPNWKYGQCQGPRKPKAWANTRMPTIAAVMDST